MPNKYLHRMNCVYIRVRNPSGEKYNHTLARVQLSNTHVCYRQAPSAQMHPECCIRATGASLIQMVCPQIFWGIIRFGSSTIGTFSVSYISSLAGGALRSLDFLSAPPLRLLPVLLLELLLYARLFFSGGSGCSQSKPTLSTDSICEGDNLSSCLDRRSHDTYPNIARKYGHALNAQKLHTRS